MDPKVRLAASALPGEKKYVLFVGAGVSKDAGLPTTSDVMLETAKLLYVHATGEQYAPRVTESKDFTKVQR